MVHQNYKLSIVSGGKPILPRVTNRSSTNKTVSALTHNQENYIVPFNNQLKIYSIDTGLCVKTIKFINNDILAKIFSGDNTFAIHISLGECFSEDQACDKVTIFTNTGSVVVLNYKGKLIDNPRHWSIELPNKGEQIFKVFQNNLNVLKILTVFQESSSKFTYNLYSYVSHELKYIKTYSNVLLSTWSSNDKFIGFLQKNNEIGSKKIILIESIVDNEPFQKVFPLPHCSSSLSSNAQFVSTMSLNNNGDQLALGFASGVINLINISDLSNRLLKWHIDSVLSLCFTNDNNYLISGGWEKVVSFWQLSTNMQQFLPRLNGVIVDCNIVDTSYYMFALQMTENVTNSDFQLVLLNSINLQPKISINGPLPIFQTMIKDVVHPLSAVNTKASISSSILLQASKKKARKLVTRKRQDYTTYLEIHPITKYLYFPHISAVQIYDFYKNEQVSYQYIASGINNSMGKVRVELNLKDPIVHQVKFTLNGLWMITYEVEYSSEGLLSSQDLSHVLKFWMLTENKEWILKTKILNPHGPNVPIISILRAPSTIDDSQGCLTADNNGGIKYWSFNSKENNWCLRKMLLSDFNDFSNNVTLAWSHDSSLIFHAFDDKLSILDYSTFRNISTDSNSTILNGLTLDSSIQYIHLLTDITLIIATRTTLSAINLLSGQIINTFDLYPYVNGVYKPGNLSRLICCDDKNSRVALVINQQLKDSNNNITLNYKSRVLVFNFDLSEKLGSFTHDEYISNISWNYGTDFIFMDIQCRLGVVSAAVSTEMMDEINNEGVIDGLIPSNDFEKQLKRLSDQKQQNIHDVEEEISLDFINGDASGKLINMNSFTNLFENIDNIQMDTLFDRVMKMIS